MTTLYSPLVGAYFRPPAKQVLSLAPANAELFLVPEPDNPYDEHAVKVMCKPRSLVPESQLEELRARLLGTGKELEDFIDQEELQLGFLPKEGNKVLNTGDYASNLAVGQFMSQRQVRARLCFAPDGSPLVRVESEP